MIVKCWDNPNRRHFELQAIADVEIWRESESPSYEILREKVRQIDALICLLTDRIDQDLIAQAPFLKVISQVAVGYDNIDLTAATTRRIPVGNTPGVLTEATADLTWALLLAAARRVVEGDRFSRSGQWKNWELDLLLGPSVTGATLGIVGMGRIGKAVAQRGKGFDMRILYTSRNPCSAEEERRLGATQVPLAVLLQESDFISLHLPLSDETYHFLGKQEFAKMKPSAMVINKARGGIIDPDALYQALKHRQIAGAAIDVAEPEPIPLDSPLLTLDNLIITPHIGSASRQTRQKMAEMAIANLIAGLKGEVLPYCANREVYDTTR